MKKRKITLSEAEFKTLIKRLVNESLINIAKHINNVWRGVPCAKISGDRILYNGKFFNLKEVEDALYDAYCEETESFYVTEPFEKWAKGLSTDYLIDFLDELYW